MKIYTKKGDRGETSLIGGKRVPKNHVRVEAYGAVDELISALGTVRAVEKDVYYQDFILTIQNKLMNAGAILAAEGEVAKKLPEITDNDITALENEIDKISANLPKLDCFIIPGGNLPESFAHLSRSVCRRAERNIIALLETDVQLPESLLMYINRLSDFLFTFARKKNLDFNSSETPWQS